LPVIAQWCFSNREAIRKKAAALSKIFDFVKVSAYRRQSDLYSRPFLARPAFVGVVARSLTGLCSSQQQWECA
jgi:hypothetical protein